MCHFKVIDEHDRLENIVALVHAAGRVNNQPIDLYRLHDYFVLTDEPEDDVADANEEVGLAFGYQSGDGGHARGEIEGGNVERDAIEEFLDGTWPNDATMTDDEPAETNQNDGEDSARAVDKEREGENLDLNDGVDGRRMPMETSAALAADNASAQQTAPAPVPTMRTGFSFVVQRSGERQMPAATQQR
jgi:hypothetical protein